MYEAILDVVELIDVLHNFLTLFRYKVLDKSVSANGNPKANVAVVYKGLGGEQRTEVREGGISSKQALCGRVIGMGLKKRCLEFLNFGRMIRMVSIGAWILIRELYFGAVDP